MAFLPLSAIVPRLSFLRSDCILYVDFTHETLENGTIYKTAFRKLTLVVLPPPYSGKITQCVDPTRDVGNGRNSTRACRRTPRGRVRTYAYVRM